MKGEKNGMIQPEMKTPPADRNSAVTDKYTEAFNLNARICISAQMAQQNLYEVCKGLKEMRDGKLYKELGYRNFEDYTEKEVGIKRHMAQKYIAIANIENGESIHHLGVTKLALLAKLDEPQREEIQQNTDLESVSVRELKNQIKELESARTETESELTESKRRNKNLVQKNIELVEQVKELENRPVEVAVQVNNDEVEKLKSIIKQTDLDWAQKYNEMEDENVKLRRADFQKHTAEIENIRKEYEEKLASASQPEAVPDTKEVFKAYLSNAADAANRLLGFVNQHREELFVSKTKEFFSTVTKKLEV